MAYDNGHASTIYAGVDIEERLPPHNLEAEEGALGSILIDPDSLIEMASFLRPDDFYRMSNRWLYEALLAMHQSGQPIDFLTVASEMRRRERLDEIGGESFLINLMNVVPTSVHAEYYARLVADTGQRRRMIAAAGRIAKLAWQEDIGVDDMVSRCESAVFVASATLARDTVQASSSMMARLFDVTMARHDNPELPVGLPSGLLDVDRILGGFKRSDMITLAARPGMGKTALALGLTLNAVRKLGKRVAFFSLEMSAEQLSRRLVAMEADIAYNAIETGRLDTVELERFNRAVGELSSTALWVDDSPSLTMSQITSRVRRLYAEHGLDLVVIDYLGLVSNESGTRFSTPNESVAAISKSVKSLAREMDIPVLALSQLNRSVESRSDKRPMLSDLRDSGAVEQDSDVVMFIYRDDYYNPDTSDRPNIAEIIVAKHRNGRTGAADVFWKAERGQMRNLETRKLTL